MTRDEMMDIAVGRGSRKLYEYPPLATVYLRDAAEAGAVPVALHKAILIAWDNLNRPGFPASKADHAAVSVVVRKMATAK